MGITTSPRRGYPVPAASIASRRLQDIQAVKTALEMLDEDVYQRIDSSLIGAPNGVAGLGPDGKVPAASLPAFVDDVLEFANVAAFPATGSPGVIYVDLSGAGGKSIYRWSGTQYIAITSSPGSTDDVAEGLVNLYFTNARASAAAPVQSVAGRTGHVSLSTDDVAETTQLYFTNARAAAAAPVQSVAGKTGNVSLTQADVSGIVPVSKGGTGIAGYSAGQILIGKADGSLAAALLSAGPNVTITNGDGTITIDAAAGGGAAIPITNDNTTGTTQYPTMARATTGDMTATYVASTKLYFNPSSGVLSSTNFNSLSDANYKVNVTTIAYGLGTVCKLRGIEADWKDGSGRTSGVIAQELEQVLPHLVETNPEDGRKTVNYMGLTGYLIEAVKELSHEVETLRAEINRLRPVA